MLALTFGQAKVLAVVVVLALIVLAIISAWIVKELAQKVVLVIVLGLLALLVWTQRSSLEDCADRVEQQARVVGGRIDTTCSFLGRDVTISRSPGS